MVDKPGIVVAGVCVYGGGGQYNYELELLDEVCACIKPFVIPDGKESPEQNIRKNVTKSMKSKMISSFLSIAMWLVQ